MLYCCHITGSRGLLSYLRCSEGSGSRTYDPNGLLNVKLSGCSWTIDRAPVMHDITVPVFMLSEPEEVEGFYGETIGSSAGVKELTGIFHRRGCVPAQGDMAVSSSEVVCLCYRVKKAERESERGEGEGEGDGDIGPGFSPFSPPSAPLSSVTTLTSVRSLADVPEPDTIIEGHLDWCERGCRSRLNGTISPTGSLSPSLFNSHL